MTARIRTVIHGRERGPELERMALGATRRDVLKLMVRQGMKLAFIGVVLGLVAFVSIDTHDEESALQCKRD